MTLLQARAQEQAEHDHAAGTPQQDSDGQTVHNTPIKPPPGFSPNNLFGDAEDDLDFVTNLSFLNDGDQVSFHYFCRGSGSTVSDNCSLRCTQC